MTADPQGLSEENRRLVQRAARMIDTEWETLPFTHVELNALLDAARSEGLQPSAKGEELTASERHELECLRHRVQQLDYPCSPHCDGYLRELALRNSQAHPAEQGKDGWQPIDTCPRQPTDDTWRILAYMPGASRFVSELWRNQSYEEAPWMWSTPAHVGRGALVFWEAITHWRPLPAAPALVEGELKNRGGSGAEERPSRGSPTDSQTAGGGE